MSSKGYASKAAFRLQGRTVAGALYPTTLGTPTPETLGPYDLLPFKSESIAAIMGFQDDDSLNGGAGIVQSSNISRLPSGSIDINGHYIGLDQLIAACMGFEKIRTDAALESPGYMLGYGGAAAISGTSTGSTGDTLSDSGASFPTTVVGEYVRLEELTTDPDLYAQVRRIIARPSTTQIQVYPDWTDNPPNGTPYTIASVFQHQYEFSKNMHTEIASDVITTPWDSLAYLARWGVLAIDKQISVWEWQACFVNSLKFKLDKEGLLITAEIIPFWKDNRTADRNSSSSTWGYHPVNLRVQKRIRFADCQFALGLQSSPGNFSEQLLGISSLEWEINNNLQTDLQTLSSGLYREEPARNGKRTVTGSFTIPRYRSDDRLDNYDDEDLLTAMLLCTGPDITGGGSTESNFEAFFRALKLKKADAPASGPELLEEKYEFQCLQPPTATSWSSYSVFTLTTGAENSELIIRTYGSYPFNNYMGQHQAT